LDAEERLERHLTQYYGNQKFTANANDWVLFLEISCQTATQASQIEHHIKRMKSKTYIKNLKKYPEIIDRLKQKYK